MPFRSMVININWLPFFIKRYPNIYNKCSISNKKIINTDDKENKKEDIKEDEKDKKSIYESKIIIFNRN